MMTPAALYTLLSANTGLTDLVGLRIYPTQAPQDATVPFVIWQRIASQPMATTGEASGNQFDLLQFSCLAATYEDADAVALALIAALDGVNVSTNDNATLQTRRDGYEEAVELHRCDCDFLV